MLNPQRLSNAGVARPFACIVPDPGEVLHIHSPAAAVAATRWRESPLFAMLAEPMAGAAGAVRRAFRGLQARYPRHDGGGRTGRPPGERKGPAPP